MSETHYYRQLPGWLAATLILGIVLGFFGRSREIPTERLGWQSFVLAKITQDAMLYRATPKQIAERVEKDLNTKVEWESRLEDSDSDPQKMGTVVLPAELGFGSMGGRWFLVMKLGKDGRCDRASMVMQPQNFM